MSKSALRKEYEAVFGVVEGALRLYDAKGWVVNETYWENGNGYWRKYQYDASGNVIYSEDADENWWRQGYDANGNVIYREFSGGESCKYQYDAEGNMIFYSEDSVDGESCKYQYDANGKIIYSEHSVDGVTLDNRPCSSKVFIEEQTGKKFKLMEIK